MTLVELLLGGLLLWWLLVCSIFIWIVIEREAKFYRESRQMEAARCRYGIKPEGKNRS